MRIKSSNLYKTKLSTILGCVIASPALACDYTTDTDNTLSISGQTNVTNCANINIPIPNASGTKRALYLTSVNNADNYGDITINTESEGTIYGIHSTATDANLSNYAVINITANKNLNDKYGTIYGIMLPNGHNIINEGNIYIQGQAASYGIRTNNINRLDNSGIININSETSKSYGIRIVTFDSLYNNGTINVTGDSASAIHLATGKFLENNGNIIANTNKASEAINASSVDDIINNGDILTKSAISSATSVRASNSNSLINNASIKSEAILSNAQAINLNTVTSVENNGILHADSKTKIATAAHLKNVSKFINNDSLIAYSGDHYAYGINSFNTTGSTIDIINNGDINSHSENRTSYGIIVDDNTNIINNGTINVTNNNAAGYGITFKGSNSYLESNHLINAKTAQVNATSSSTININSYAIKFNGSQSEINDTYEGKLIYDNTSSYNFNNAKLNVYLGNKFKNNDIYEIPTLTKNSATGLLDNTSDQFNTAIGITNPDYNYDLINGNGAENQKIKVSFKPKSSNTQKNLKVNANLSKNTAKRIKNDVKRMIIPSIQSTTGVANKPTSKTNNTNFTSSGFDETVQGLLSLQDPKSRQSIINKINNSFSFITPYYSTTTDSSNYGYQADMTGVVTGINYLLENGILAGFHIGYGSSDIEYTGEGYETKTEESKNYSIGAQAAKTVNNFILSAVSSLTFLRNNYHDASSTNTEHAKYSATSLNSSFEVGYIKKLADFTIIPKLGLSHYWFKSNEYEIENLQNPNSVVGRINESNIAANIGAEVYSTHTVDDLTIRPNFNFNIEQILTDNNLNNTITAGQTTQTVSSSADSTTYTFGSNVAFEKGKNTTTVGFNSSMSDNIRNNTLFIEYKRKF